MAVDEFITSDSKNLIATADCIPEMSVSCLCLSLCFISALPPFSFLAVPVTKVIHTFIECTERAPNDPLTATSGSLAGERKHPELHYISGDVPSSPLPVCSHTFQRTGYIFLRKKSFSPQEVRSVWRATCLWIGRNGEQKVKGLWDKVDHMSLKEEFIFRRVCFCGPTNIRFLTNTCIDCRVACCFLLMTANERHKIAKIK